MSIGLLLAMMVAPHTLFKAFPIDKINKEHK